MLGGWQHADLWPHGPSETCSFSVLGLHFYKSWPLRIICFRREQIEQRAEREPRLKSFDPFPGI